jgi:class 3 adenylate cyclase
MLRALGAYFRVIMFDKRGGGLSGRFEGVPTLEERMDDVRDVMRAAGSTRAVLPAHSEGGPTGALFTATESLHGGATCPRALGRQRLARLAAAIGLDLRAGLHIGEVESIGSKVSGMAAHVAARISAHAGSGEVLVSTTVKDLVVGSRLRFEACGTKSLKGVPGDWLLFRAIPDSD